jgi:tellurite resistance protein TerC
MHVSIPIWFITVAVLAGVLAVDLAVIGRRPHEPSPRECSLAIGAFVGLALLFGAGVLLISGPQYGAEFFAGWLTEYSLSLDNLFVFILIMANLKVPRHLQQFALMVGIMLALVFRGAFIAAGAALISRFSWVFFIFGAFLVYTAAKLVTSYHKGENDGGGENAVIRLARRLLPSSEGFDGTRLLTRANGRRLLTPMFFVIVALGSADLLFALDSIPAIYGLTQEPYLVFTANVFALMGLRQLYFLIGGLLKQLVYLSLGLSVVLAFIGAKLVLHAMHEYGWDAALGFDGEIPIWLSLAVIIGVLAVTTLASLLKSRTLPPSAEASDG